MVSRAKPGEIASSPILLANRSLRGMNKIDAEGIDLFMPPLANLKMRSIFKFASQVE